MTRSFYQQCAAAGSGGLLLALLARLVLRDRVPGVAMLVYAAPPLLLASGALACAAAWALARRRRPALGFLALAFLCGAWQAGVSRARHPYAKGELRLLLWNVANGGAGWERLAPEIAACDADVVCLVEADGGAPERMPPGAWRWIDPGLAVGVNGRILSAELVPLGEGSRAALLKLEVRGRLLTAILVDIGASPLRPRSLAFGPLDDLRRRLKPDLILGDFNTPRDSVHFDGWRGDLSHAFEAAGDGWDLTWPRPVRVLSIDHVWCAPTLAPRHAAHVSRPSSDHTQVVVELGFRE
jgi:vancomycin resistance protein VanJ